jgi:hypothetical protein
MLQTMGPRLKISAIISSSPATTAATSTGFHLSGAKEQLMSA